MKKRTVLASVRKTLSGIQTLVTGGCGFIGSHLVDALMSSGSRVCVVDNLSSGRLDNIGQWLENENLEFWRGDLLNENDVTRIVKGCHVVFHTAANPDVRTSSVSPGVHFQQNVVATYSLLETVRKVGDAETIVFTSSSTVYGEAPKIPTPEDYAPLEPISVHGASKLACEALLTAYAHNYGFKAVIYRLSNIVGRRSRHGVIYDFVQKLRDNPYELEILGDGTQTKSYLHVSDCMEAMFLGLGESKRRVDVFNVGSEDQIDVKTIAQIVVKEMGLKKVRLVFTGGVDGGRGWRGDVKNMLLDVDKLKSLGWKPRFNSEEAVKQAARGIVTESLTS